MNLSVLSAIWILAQVPTPAPAPAPQPDRPPTPPPASAPTDIDKARDLADASDVAESFLDAMVTGQALVLAGLGTVPFTFDGRILPDRQAALKHWEKVLATRSEQLRDAGAGAVDLMDYTAALGRYGQPPAKLGHLELKRCLFAAVTFQKHTGFLLILQKTKDEGWRVAAVTD